MKHKITIEIDEITSRQAGQLAAWKGVGFREYLAKALEQEIDAIVEAERTEEKCLVSLEISKKAYEWVVYQACDVDGIVKRYVTDAVNREWGDRG